MGGRSGRYSSDEIAVYDGDIAVGDDEELGSRTGGHDTFYGDSYGISGYTAYGDAQAMFGRSRGGNDVFYGGDEMDAASGGFFGDSSVSFAGDAAEMAGKSRGGADAFHGGLNSANYFAGDALQGMYDQARGGSDMLQGGDAYGGTSSNMLLGDAYAFEGDRVAGGADHLQGGDALGVDGYDSQVMNVIAGDAYAMHGFSTGRSDVITGGSVTLDDGYGIATNMLMGDGFVMTDAARGGNDAITGGDTLMLDGGGEGYAMNIIAGDAYALIDGARAGNDRLVGGNAVVDQESEPVGYAVVLNLMAGDALFADGVSGLGNDTLTGGSGTEGADAYALNIMYGDVLDLDGYGFFFLPGIESLGSLSALASGPGLGANDALQALTYGNDALIGGATQAMNHLVGDAAEIHAGQKGGNDLLEAGGASTENVLIGDGSWIYSGGVGGDDRLVSGAGDDQMWGDASEGMDGTGGADRFVFSWGNGDDTIHDFRESDGDKIDLGAFRSLFSRFDSLVQSGRLQEQESGVWIDLSQPDSEETHGVMVLGVALADLGSASFIF